MIFPKIKEKNSRLYVAINIFQNLWFIEAVWYFFFSNFVSYFQIGLVFAVSVIIGILAEIPTGVIADRYGRKFSVIIGSLIMTIGWFLMATTNGFGQFLVGSILGSLGRAFVSGALEAIVYEALPTKNRDKKFEYLVTMTDQITTILFSVTVLVGGFLYHYYIRLPHLLFAFSNFIAFLLAFRLRDLYPHQSFDNPDNLLTSNLAGFRELFKPAIRRFLIPAFSTLAFFFLYDWGFSKPSMALNFGFQVEGQAVIYAIFSIINTLGIRSLPYFRKKVGDSLGLIILNSMMALGFVLGSMTLGHYGVFALLSIELAGYISKPWISIILNQHVVSRYRATTLSTLEFMAKIPYVFTNVVLGSYLDSGQTNSFHLTIGLFMIFLVIIYIIGWIKNKYELAKNQ